MDFKTKIFAQKLIYFLSPFYMNFWKYPYMLVNVLLFQSYAPYTEYIYIKSTEMWKVSGKVQILL